MAIRRIPHPMALPLSQAVVCGPFVFLSGQIAIGPEGRIVGDDVGAQTRLVMEGIARSLAACGATLADVVRVTVWLADLADFAAFNLAYRSYFADGAFPARSTVQAGLYGGARVEIEVQAYLSAASHASAAEAPVP